MGKIMVAHEAGFVPLFSRTPLSPTGVQKYMEQFLGFDHLFCLLTGGHLWEFYQQGAFVVILRCQFCNKRKIIKR